MRCNGITSLRKLSIMSNKISLEHHHVQIWMPIWILSWIKQNFYLKGKKNKIMEFHGSTRNVISLEHYYVQMWTLSRIKTKFLLEKSRKIKLAKT